MQTGLRPGDKRLKAAGEKLCSSPRGYDDVPNLQEIVTDGPAPLKNEGQDKRQRGYLSPAKPINNSREIKIESE